jgi:C-terminal processing protease CtpA/Prc
MILETPTCSKREIFDCFWKGIDRRYSYFEQKGIEWDRIKSKYAVTINEEMSNKAFYDTLCVLIDKLKDGHSGITSSFDEHKNIYFYSRGQENYNERLIVDNYAKGWGEKKGNITHMDLRNGNIGYMHYSSFSDEVTAEDIDFLIKKFKNTKGIIIDIRNNFGGAASNIFVLLKRFTNKRTHIYDTRIKNGPEHNDFTELTKVYLNPAEITYNGKVCVLTNRKVFSAASIFTLAMRELPNVTIVGDTTGGGLGLPIGFELPNGWQVHCAGSQTLSVKGLDYEMGVPPDIQTDMNQEDINKGVDSIIEKAIAVILE